MPHAIKMLQDDNNSMQYLGQLQAIPAGQADAEDKAAVQVASMLTTHHTLEQEFITPMLARFEPALADESDGEHAAARRLLDEIEDLPSGMERRDVMLDLQAVVKAHAETQEASVFPLLERELGVVELEHLGRSMMTRQQELLHESADTTGAAETAGQNFVTPRI